MGNTPELGGLARDPFVRPQDWRQGAGKRRGFRDTLRSLVTGDQSAPELEAPPQGHMIIGREIQNGYGIERMDSSERMWGIRNVRPEDIQTIARWFRSPSVLAQIYDENVNRYLPSWTNARDVRNFEKALERFFIPKGPFKMSTHIPHLEGSPKPKNREIVVNRTAKVALTLDTDEKGNEKWVPAGVQCWLDNDPYAPQEDRDRIDGVDSNGYLVPDHKRLRVAYGHFMIVDPRYREKAVALYLSTVRADELLGKSASYPGKFDMISGLVKRAHGDTAPNWDRVISFFMRFGYDFDRRPEGKSIVPLGKESGETLDRMLITANDWHSRSREAAIAGLWRKDIKYR